MAVRRHAIVYDCEIENAIPHGNEERHADIVYCGGWKDYVGMGIACIAAIDLWTGRPHVFLKDNLSDFQKLVAARGHVIGFNSKSFDDPLCQAHGLTISTSYDLGDEVMGALRARRKLVKGGQTLGALSSCNLGMTKSLAGGDAPILWQRGQKGTVINYGLKDTWLLAELVNLIPQLKDPVTGQTFEVPQAPGIDEQMELAA